VFLTRVQRGELQKAESQKAKVKKVRKDEEGLGGKKKAANSEGGGQRGGKGGPRGGKGGKKGDGNSRRSSNSSKCSRVNSSCRSCRVRRLPQVLPGVPLQKQVTRLRRWASRTVA